MSPAANWGLGLVAVLLTTSCALAETRQFSTESGMSVVLSQPHNWQGDCTPGTAKVRIVEQPDHGTLIVRMARYQLGDFGYPDAPLIGTLPESCEGTSIIGPQVVYTPEAGFVGTDTLVLRFTFGLIEPGESKYVIAVD